jgi:hypothetical protein
MQREDVTFWTRKTPQEKAPFSSMVFIDKGIIVWYK